MGEKQTADTPDLVRGNPASPVAICTLSSHDLLGELAASDLQPQVAIIGTLETENTGIEQMLTTLLRTPTIRWLILCGEQNPRRKQGNVLKALFQAGVTADGEVAGMPGRRLPKLRSPHIDAIRRQVTLEDLSGEHDLGVIEAAVQRCSEREAPLVEPPPALPGESTPTIQVPVREFKVSTLDPNGYFVILLDRAGAQLCVEHYGYDYQLRHRLAAADAESLMMALLEWGMISRPDHATYMGMELTRAEHALRFNLAYRQDSGPLPVP